MKVRTFVLGTISGIEESLKKLDKQTNELHATEIISIEDILYPGELEENDIPRIARRVVYK